MANSNAERRSDRLRDRRSSRRKSARPTASRRTKSTGSHKPPVLVRGMVPLDSMAAPKRRSRTRRRYDIALSVPGAELRLPAMPSVRFGWRAVSFFLVGLLAMSLYVLWNSPVYQVQGLQIEGLQRLTEREITTLLDLTGERIFVVDTTAVAAEISERFPEFSAVDVSINLPAEVTISVTERIPVLVWYQNGRTSWVDEQGYAFPAREGMQAPPLMINAAGAPREVSEEQQESGQLLTPEMVKAILLIREVAPQERPLLYSVEHGLGWNEKKGWDVYLGTDFEQMDTKLKIYDAILKHLKQNNLTPALVSVELLHAPYYTMEQ